MAPFCQQFFFEKQLAMTLIPSILSLCFVSSPLISFTSKFFLWFVDYFCTRLWSCQLNPILELKASKMCRKVLCCLCFHILYSSYMCVSRAKEEACRDLMMCVILNPFFVLGFSMSFDLGDCEWYMCKERAIEGKAYTNGYTHNMRTMFNSSSAFNNYWRTKLMVTKLIRVHTNKLS